MRGRRTSAPSGTVSAHHDLVVAGDLADRAALPGDVDEDAREQVVARRLDLDAVAARADHFDIGNARERRRVESRRRRCG